MRSEMQLQNELNQTFKKNPQSSQGFNPDNLEDVTSSFILVSISVIEHDQRFIIWLSNMCKVWIYFYKY